MRQSFILAFAILLTFTACEESNEKTKKIPSSIGQIEDDITKTITGTVMETSPIEDLGGGLWIYLNDENGGEFYLDFYRNANVEKYDALAKDLVGKKIQAFYKVKKEQIAIDVQSLGMIGGKANRDYQDMTVYMVKGEQTNVEENEAGLMITIKTNKGTVLKYRANNEVYYGAKPTAYNGQKVQIIYTEEELVLMSDYQIMEEN
jgi:hypothetical protein